MSYTFGYDALGRKTGVKVGTQTLSENVYANDRSGMLSEVRYGNGGKVKYTYDDYKRLTGIRYDNETEDRYGYEYDAGGNVVRVSDKALGRVQQTEYDLTGRPMGTQLRDTDGNILYRTELDYDSQNRLEGFGEMMGGNSFKTTYAYDNDNRVTETGFGGNEKVRYTYDCLGRISGRISESGTETREIRLSWFLPENRFCTCVIAWRLSKINGHGA